MRTVTLVLAAALVVAPFAATAAAASDKAASDKTDVMATVNQFGDGFNNGDKKTAMAACADQSSILDGIPPFSWQGATACSDWWNDINAVNEKHGITSPHVTFATPQHADVAGDRAYVIVPATYAFMHKGKQDTLSAIFTAALQKLPAGWRITSWAWVPQ